MSGNLNDSKSAAKIIGCYQSTSGCKSTNCVTKFPKGKTIKAKKLRRVIVDQAYPSTGEIKKKKLTCTFFKDWGDSQWTYPSKNKKTGIECDHTQTYTRGSLNKR